jgi:hypothetical protein
VALAFKQACYGGNSVKLEWLRGIEPKFHELEHLQSALKRKVSCNGVVKRGVAAYEQVGFGQAKGLHHFKVNLIGQANGEGLFLFLIDNSPNCGPRSVANCRDGCGQGEAAQQKYGMTVPAQVLLSISTAPFQ